MLHTEVSVKMDEKKFAERIAELRNRKGVSAREMSLAMGQNASYINHIENGKALPSVTGLFYICEYLGVTPMQFFDTESKNPTRLDEINSYLRKLSPAQLDIVLGLVKEMTKK